MQLKGDPVDSADGAHAAAENSALRQREVLDEVSHLENLFPAGAVDDFNRLGPREDLVGFQRTRIDFVRPGACREVTLGVDRGFRSRHLAVDLLKIRFGFKAGLDGNRAALRKGAALRQRVQLRRPTLKRYQALLAGGDDVRHGAQQADGVRHARPVEDVVNAAGLNELPGVHDGHLVGVAGNNTEVVGDEDDGRPRDFLCLA